MRQIQYRKFTFSFLLLSLFLGVLLYDYLGSAYSFSYVDELLILLLVFQYVSHRHERLREFSHFIVIILFYILYSLWIQTNVVSAIVMDVLIEIKPFIAFYCVCSLNMGLSDKQKSLLCKLSVAMAVAVFLCLVISYDFIIYGLLGHPSRLATLFQILGMAYLFGSKRQTNDFIITFIIWAVAMLSFRSKSYAFFAIAFFLFYCINSKRLVRISFSSLFLLSLGVCLLFIVTWVKFRFYFVEGGSSDYTEAYARPALYQCAFLLFKDFFPFGTGFGSYACYASAAYYSPIYIEYGLNSVYGLSQSNPMFVADTFFPQLAQYGVIGALFFFMFFLKRYKQTVMYFRLGRNDVLMKMSILVLLFFMIESTSDSTFVQNRGIVMMVLWGMIMNELRNKVPQR